jgi:hypothetical protein
MDKNEDDPKYIADPLSALGPEGRERLQRQRGLNEMFVVLGLTGLIVLFAVFMFFFDY